jgi:hypothetical protein
MNLCLGHAADDTFRYSLSRFATLGVSFDALDMTQVALEGRIAGNLSDADSVTIELHGSRYVLGQYAGVFWRMIETIGAAPTEHLKARSLAHYRILSSALARSGARIVNRPGTDCSNASKLLHQSAMARALQMRVPRSLITTDPREAEDFIEACTDGTIIKGASAQKTWVSSIAPHDVTPRFRECPSLLQERILGDDIRVHVVQEKCVAERISSEEIDYRRESRCRHSPYLLSDAQSRLCVAITRYLGVVFSGIDFKLEECSGELVFLEANTMPCYQGYDRRARGTISEALCAYLTSSPTTAPVRSQLLVES